MSTHNEEHRSRPNEALHAGERPIDANRILLGVVNDLVKEVDEMSAKLDTLSQIVGDMRIMFSKLMMPAPGGHLDD